MNELLGTATEKKMESGFFTGKEKSPIELFNKALEDTVAEHPGEWLNATMTFKQAEDGSGAVDEIKICIVPEGHNGAGEHQRDNCEVCRGERGGVPGNENVINGKVVCDYCHSAQLSEPNKS